MFPSKHVRSRGCFSSYELEKLHFLCVCFNRTIKTKKTILLMCRNSSYASGTRLTKALISFCSPRPCVDEFFCPSLFLTSNCVYNWLPSFQNIQIKDQEFLIRSIFSRPLSGKRSGWKTVVKNFDQVSEKSSVNKMWSKIFYRLDAKASVNKHVVENLQPIKWKN